jgi:hypothetical protein
MLRHINPNEDLSMSGENQDTVQIEIGVEKLESLFNKGELCVFDFRCLNCESKKCIWNLCLTSCAKRMHCNLLSFERHAYCEQSAEKVLKDPSVFVCVKQDNLAKLA